MADGANTPRRSIFRRCCDQIDTHPIPTLILVVALITFVFWNKVDGAIVVLNHASNDLHNATGRIDALVREAGTSSEQIREINEETKKIEVVRSTVVAMNDTIGQIDRRLKAIKPYETRVIESFGIAVDKDIIVDVVQGSVMAFPLTDTKIAELERANFRKTASTIFQPVFANGWVPPVTTASLFNYPISTPTLSPNQKRR